MEHHLNSKKQNESALAVVEANNLKQISQQDYLERLYLMVEATEGMAGRLPTDEAKLALAEIWFEQISDEIPVDKLSECYQIAKANHTGPFAINAYELLDAMKAIVARLPISTEEEKLARYELQKRPAPFQIEMP